MRRSPALYNAYQILGDPQFFGTAHAEIPTSLLGVPYNGDAATIYVPARPMGPSWDRWRAVWLVLRGRADVLYWPGQER